MNSVNVVEDEIKLHQDNDKEKEGEVDVNIAHSTFPISYEIEKEAKTNGFQREKKQLNIWFVMKYQICLQNEENEKIYSKAEPE